MAFGNFAGGFAQGMTNAIELQQGQQKINLLRQQQQNEQQKQILDGINTNIGNATKQIQLMHDGISQKIMAIQNSGLPPDQISAQISQLQTQEKQAVSSIVAPLEQTITAAANQGLPVRPGTLQSMVDNILNLSPTASEGAQNKAITAGATAYAEQAGKNRANQENPPPSDDIRSQKIQELIARGFSLSDAQDIADGRVKTSEPDQFGNIYLTNTATGEVRAAKIPGTQPQQQSQKPQGSISNLESKVKAGTGPLSRTRELYSDYIQSLFSNKITPEIANTVQAKQAVSLFNQEVKQALANNPKFPVSEMKLITETMLPDPTATFVDPNAQVLKVRQLHEYLINKRGINENLLANGNITKDRKVELANQNSTIDQILGMMENPKDFSSQLKGMSLQELKTMPLDSLDENQLQQLKQELLSR